ncbi:MAG: hypothetical protein JZU62_10175 [Sulfuricurvum sp.]|uniref:hypothetical protein n=1 Tax=Sulfuricurvum sp. TaxID=2025608 RepID=UPI0025DF5324|nr:hypothetical protein [Sulfuricurvum sp.]MBV5322047.1 hypothetical protein [Sulfuricurvum sp.]
MNRKFFWFLYTLQVIVAYSSLNAPTDAPTEGLIKFLIVYIVAWYLFKIPFISAFIVNKFTIGLTIMFYMFIAITMIAAKDAGISWGDTIGLLSLFFLIPLIVFFLGYLRLKEIGVDILQKSN